MPKGSKVIPAPAPIVPISRPQRIRDYGAVLATLIKDDRLSGNRRMLAALLGKYFSIGSKNGKAVPMTELETKDKDMLYNVIVEQYGNPKSIQWLDSFDVGPTEAGSTRLELDSSAQIKDVFEQMMRK